MNPAAPSERPSLGAYGGHNGLITLVLLTLAVTTVLLIDARQFTAAAGVYVLAFAVAAPLALGEASALRTWLRR